MYKKSSVSNLILTMYRIRLRNLKARSRRAERSKDRNKAAAVTTKLKRTGSNTLICFTEHTLKRIEKKLCSASYAIV